MSSSPREIDLTIAVSGKSGCGNSTVSRIVAERLGLRLINYTFKSIAEERGMAFSEVSQLAETDDSYDRLVDETQVGMAADGRCVLGSRLAIWLVKQADLKVYLSANIDIRVARIVNREGGEPTEVRFVTEDRDSRDKARYKRLYGFDIDSYDFADLIIDANSPDQYAIAEMIIGHALQLTR